MSAYRFCRTDDIQLLVDALNRCWAPYFPDEPPMTAGAFKRTIRDLQVWCSSCMVAFSGSEPIGVLIGAKRPHATLVHRIAVHPDHRRQGHGRHLLDSLGSKLAILGPPRIVAEVPDTLAAARELFNASGYAEEALLTDYVLPAHDDPRAAERSEASALALSRFGATAFGWQRQASANARGGSAWGWGPKRIEKGGGPRALREAADGDEGRLIIPVTVDDLVANGLLPDAESQVCWERAVETLTARKNAIEGLAAASGERIEAYILYVESGEIVALRSLIDDGGARLKQLLSHVAARGVRNFRLPKVHPAEIAKELLEILGFRSAGRHLLYAARARSA